MDNKADNFTRNIVLTQHIKAGNMEIAKQMIDESNYAMIKASEKSLTFLLSKKGKISNALDFDCMELKLKMIKNKLNEKY